MRQAAGILGCVCALCVVFFPVPVCGGEFALGVEYMVPGFAEVYARTGVVWAKAAAVGLTWGDIEPQPPANGKHTYRWENLDRLILEYQQAGFRHIQFYVRCMNRWASSKPIKPVGGGSFPPKPECLDDYRAFLVALVQRYDTGNPGHLPGLLYPVEHWEIESEWGTGFWQGTLAEYLDLLRIAYPTVKGANPRAQVILIGFFLAGVFEGHPDPSQLPSILAGLPAKRRAVSENYLSEVRKLLGHPELYDIVEFHSLSDWTEISGMARFLRQTMHGYGYEKPVWVGDVNYTASPLTFWGVPVPPYTERQKPAIEETLNALANPRHNRHREVEEWFRAEQARGLVKKAVLAMAEGCAGINIGNMKDEPLFSFAPEIAGTAAFHGLVDTKGVPPRPGTPRPAYHALMLVAQKIANFSSVQRVDAGEGVYAYRFLVEERPVYVAWHDDGRRYLPGDREPLKEVAIVLPQAEYLMREIPTGKDAGATQTVVPDGGRLKLTLGLTPVLLEPSRP